MSDIVIRVNNLGKKYRIHHRRTARYTALRDVIADKARAMFRRGLYQARGAAAVEDFWALKDVSFEVRRGEVIGIIGRNGAGKSTLLKILSRITEPSRGRIELEGTVASLLEVGTGFHPELTGRENVFLNGAILGMSRAQIANKFDEIVAFAEVEQFVDTPVKRYSSGMYLRLAFAVAAHLEPEILVVDEVLAVGDMEFQKKCLWKMRDVSAEGRTVLFVSHNMAAIRALCGVGMLLDHGNLRFVGEIEGAVKAYEQNGSIGEGSSLKPTIRESARPHFVSLALDRETYEFGETPRVACELLSQSDAKVAIELEIRDEKGFPLIYASTSPMYGALLHLRSGVLSRVSLVLGPLALARGAYTIHFWLIRPWSENYHVPLEHLRFRIGSSDPGGVGFDFRQDYGRGALAIPLRIELDAGLPE